MASHVFCKDYQSIFSRPEIRTGGLDPLNSVADDKPPQITLTVFLIKEDRGDVDSFLLNKDSLDKYTIKNGRETIGDLYVKLSQAKPPGWGKFFADYIDAKDLGKASSTGAVLVVRVSERWFAVTFGQTGRHLLEPECWEERFGLLAAFTHW